MTSPTRIALFVAVLVLESTPVDGFAKSMLKEPVFRTNFEKHFDSFPTLKKRARLEASIDGSDYLEWYVPPPKSTESSEPSKPKIPRGAVAQHKVIESDSDFIEFLNEDDRLCVVKFHATWCKNCHKFAIHFDKLAAQKADWLDRQTGDVIKRNEIRVASVEWTQCENLCELTGITKLPTVLLFRNGRKVTEVSVGSSKFSKVRDAVEQYSDLSSKDTDFVTNLEEGAVLINSQVLATTDKKMTSPPAAEEDEKPAAGNLTPRVESTAASFPFAPAALKHHAPQRRHWDEPKGQAAASY